MNELERELDEAIQKLKALIARLGNPRNEEEENKFARAICGVEDAERYIYGIAFNRINPSPVQQERQPQPRF